MHAGADDEGERQERQPGGERPRAEHVLQVQRGQQERAEQHRGGREHHHEAASDATVAEALHAQQRLGGAQFEHGEGGEPGERGGTEAERLGRGPAAALGLGEGVDERAEAGGGQQRAAQVEAAPLRPGRVGGQQLHRAGGQGEADGQVDEEDRAPVDELGQHAAEQHADRGAGAADRAPDAQRLGTLGAVEGARDDRQRRRGQQRGAEALSGTRREQHRGATRERGSQRGRGEDGQAGEEDAAAAEQVGGAPAEQQQAAEDQRVAGDRPADVGLRDVQVLRQVRERDVDRADVEDDHQLRDAQQQEQ